ncbi:MAG TPA: LamG domain-containing protein, partial [Nocardioidaceae bacterium]|nr:LamG domain-containing protein [Nocardioidaceae bacterium]
LDTLGNATTYTSPDIKVDLTAPAAPSLAHSGFTNTYWSSGAVVYYRSAASSGSFTTTSTATDTKSGIASHTFASLGTNWASTPGALGVNTYSWSGAPAVPGAKSITATNNATIASGDTSFTPTADDTAPTAGSVSYVDGDTMGTSVTVTFAAGTDSGSGIGTHLLQRASATRTNGICGTFGGFTTVTNGTNPTSPLANTVVKGNCYKYQYVVADNVGNQHTASSANVAYNAFGAYYALDAGSGTTAVDSSGNANTGTLQAGATWTTGRIGPYAVNLTGATNSFVDVTPAVIDSSQSYSVSAWIKPSTLTGFQTIASIDGNAISPFYVQVASGVLQFTARGSDSTGSTTTTVTGGSAVAGTWYHLVAVHDNVANTISLYVNGTLKNTTAFNSPWEATGHTVIGRAKWNGASADFVNGAIDEVHFFDRVLTGSEVSGLGPDTTGPTGGSVDASGLVGTGSRYAASTTLSLDLAKGTDPSGVATTGNLLKRATATLTSGGTANGTCGSFGSYTTVTGGTDPTSPKSDIVADQACYSYQYVVLDTLGNATTYTSPDIKVDLTAPAAPSLA